VVLGGWGSLPGAVAGALLIALFEVIFPSLPVVAPIVMHLPGASELFSQTSSTIVFDILVLLVLLVRPQGLFGEAVQARP
jgi:branched-chain amino acid transport system permease protein